MMGNEKGFLKPEEVKYLAFEGGGGKGNAFLGAVKGLEEEGVLKYKNGRISSSVKGIAGASAGAITALFLASGYSFESLRKDIFSVNFNDFFDPPVVGEIIVAGSGKSKSTGKTNTASKLNDLSKYLPLLSKKGIYDKIIMEVMKMLLSELDIKKKSFKLSDIKEYLICLQNDFGVFSGANIHSFFNQKVTEGIAKIDAKVEKNLNYLGKNKWWTFKEHYEYFKIDLKFTAVNMRTENLYVLSKDTTPNLPVATAARMSMSLPFIFKPVIINKQSEARGKINSKLNGLWLDGGLFNNTPLNLFNSDKTILLRLGERMENHQFDSLFDFIKTYLAMGAMGSAGSGQINEFTVRDYLTQVIELNIDGTSLLKFNLEKPVLDKLIKINSKRIKGYFSQQSIP
ncbi:MAG: hypothetical protein GX762_01390 [Bacteroidales bacterium]|nr:hypothetical protein [Clostridium sp.]NLC49011.1 hypothetical protein [Bacteroidales bacterium]